MSKEVEGSKKPAHIEDVLMCCMLLQAVSGVLLSTVKFACWLRCCEVLILCSRCMQDPYIAWQMHASAATRF